MEKIFITNHFDNKCPKCHSTNINKFGRFLYGPSNSKVCYEGYSCSNCKVIIKVKE